MPELTIKEEINPGADHWHVGALIYRMSYKEYMNLRHGIISDTLKKLISEGVYSGAVKSEHDSKDATIDCVKKSQSSYKKFLKPPSRS